MKKKPTLTKKDILHIAKLINLELTDEEINRFKKQLSEVIDYINKLNEVKIKDINPINQTTGLENITREDKIETLRLLTQDEALRNTSLRKNGFFKIKAIFKK